MYTHYGSTALDREGDNLVGCREGDGQVGRRERDDHLGCREGDNLGSRVKTWGWYGKKMTK